MSLSSPSVNEPVYLPASKEEWGELTDVLLSLAWEFAERRATASVPSEEPAQPPSPNGRTGHEERLRIFHELWTALDEKEQQCWNEGCATAEMQQTWGRDWKEKVRQRSEQEAPGDESA